MLAIPALALFWTSAAPAVPESEIGTFPIYVSVAEEDGAPVQDGAWIDAQIARAEQLYAPHGVHLKRAARRTIAEEHANLVTRADRDRLMAFLQPGAINVIVVGTLKDVDEKDRWRSGVHWRPAPNIARRFIILAATAAPTVLAHELGHYFGNGHSAVTNNVMSYSRTSEEVFFDDAQIRTIRASARVILQSKEVRAVPPQAPAASPAGRP